eukprot:GDKK01028758.1.p1 GENE.GDKK01028758.1~~GDKK01028758.1.p1  ORF type:complete len:659 (-),score=143.56 GDKK01028758.1:36-1853(-)
MIDPTPIKEVAWSMDFSKLSVIRSVEDLKTVESGFVLSPHTLESASTEKSSSLESSSEKNNPKFDVSIRNGVGLDENGRITMLASQKHMLGVPKQENPNTIQKVVLCIPNRAAFKTSCTNWWDQFVVRAETIHKIIIKKPKVFFYDSQPKSEDGSMGYDSVNDAMKNQPSFIVKQLSEQVLALKSKPDIVILFLMESVTRNATYELFKTTFASFKKGGVTTQCIIESSINSTVRNVKSCILMKILAKLGGAAYKVALSLQKVMSIGLEVRGGKQFASVASVSLDSSNTDFATQFAIEGQWKDDEMASQLLKSKLEAYMESHPLHELVSEEERHEYFKRRYKNRFLRAAIGLRDVCIRQVLQKAMAARGDLLPSTIFFFHRDVSLAGEARWQYTRFLFDEIMKELIDTFDGCKQTLRLKKIRVIMIYVQAGCGKAIAESSADEKVVADEDGNIIGGKSNELMVVYDRKDSEKSVGSDVIDRSFWVLNDTLSTRYNVAAYAPPIDGYAPLDRLAQKTVAPPTKPLVCNYDDDEDDDQIYPNYGEEEISLSDIVDSVREMSLGYVAVSGSVKYPSALKHCIELCNKAAKFNYDQSYINQVTNTQNAYV